METLVAQPRNARLVVVETGRDEQRVVGSLLKLHPDVTFVDRDRRGGVDEILEQMARFRHLVAVADTLAKQYPNVKVVHHKTNQGYGGALKSGFLNAKKYRYIFYTDGDNQYDVNVLKKMLPYLKNYDAIVGKRTNRALKFRRRIQTSFYNWLIRFLFHLDNQDINCAIRLFKRSAINRIDIANISASAFFPAQLLLALYKNGAKIKEANVKHYPRRFGKESGGKINVIIPTILDMFNYYFAFHSSRALDKD